MGAKSGGTDGSHTDKQLRDAMERADMPPRDYRIYGALVYRADWATGKIPEQFQPRSVENVAKISRMSRAGAAEGLSHLERHGWIIRQGGSSRGRPNRYVLCIGTDCDCKTATAAKAPTPEAERARRYRARKNQSRIRVTTPSGESEIRVMTSPASRDEMPAQDPVSAEEGRDEGEGWGGWPDDSIGAEENGY